MEVEIIARETIKPSSPTPQSLRKFKLSLIDQLTPPVYGSLLYFYSFNGDTNRHVSVSERSQQLKKSFSDTLTLFYPFAGRTVDNIMIDCSDYGALFIEARVDCPLSRFLRQPNGDELKRFIPTQVESTEASTGFFSLVQASFFDCGGVAIGVCISHKLADGTTLGTFVRCWAAVTVLGSDRAEMVPIYNAAALFPPRKFPEAVPPLVDIAEERFSVKRFVFDASRVAALKAAAASASVERPSRAEAVTALLWKCALNAARSNSGSKRPSLLTRPVNIRRRISPPLPDSSVGNLVGFYMAEKDDIGEVEIKGLVRELRERIQVFDKNYVKMLQKEDGFEQVTDYFKEAASQMMRQDVEFYICTSLCNGSMYDHVDFGWGKPVWVTIPSANNKNVMELIDTRKGDGSVEAWVVLSKDDMYLFERDPELLAFASSNPSILEEDTDTTRHSLWINSSI
ncbi:hypothetical protein ACOSP7_018573 [Xanthoceras sorbifolium]|uniref:BAHD acyltransferase n=1 Tax=Xanthoceras sorbifolium TaxID=99658 RepID=A0ABQ8I1E2_9ROSI|nr:hypothetical protein JRO89_XS05G0106100 [Xanthoceras sorbifolium]